MNDSVTYIGENGEKQTHTLTESESREALSNDYDELLRIYNPKLVEITRRKAEEGEALHLEITVHAPSHYLSSKDDTDPKPCDTMKVEVICYPGYPLKAARAEYAANRYLASPNVFTSGKACIGTWIPLKSSILTVVQKLVMDIIHNPDVTRYDSLANHNPSICEWHKEGVRAGRFPTLKPSLLYAPEHALPPRRRLACRNVAPPPMPPRNLNRR